MTHIRLKFVQAFIDKKTGGPFRYFRRPGCARVRLPGLPGSSEFMRAYEAALEGPALPIGAKRTRPGSVSAAIAGYYTSLEFRSLAVGTQGMRRAVLERFRAAHGDKPIAVLPPKFIALTLSTLGPFAARNYLKALRGLLRFAVGQEMCEHDPTQGIKLPRVKTDGIYTWSEPDIDAFRATHAIGAMARLAFELALNTALRRGDLIRIGRQHIRDGVLHVRQQKTGGVLAIPVHPELQHVLDATPSAHLTLLVNRGAEPFTGPRFSPNFPLSKSIRV